MRTERLRSVVYLGGILGALVSAFAALESTTASLQNVCSINSFFSCGAVNGSGKTATLGVPDYLWGIVGFVAILVVAGLAESRASDRRWSYGLLALTTAGVGLSLYFLYVELAEIHAFCVVCATAYLLGWVAWAGSIGLARAPTTTVKAVETGESDTAAVDSE